MSGWFFLQGSTEEVSVFVFDIKNGSDTQLEVAKGAVKRLKTLRHPSVLTYLDSLESDKVLYLATEYVEPLSMHLEKLALDGPQKDLYIAWGIFQITVSSRCYFGSQSSIAIVSEGFIVFK